MEKNWLEKLDEKIGEPIKWFFKICSSPYHSIIEDSLVLEAKIMGVDWGPLHVLWLVSIGCWVTWSISSWQEYYKSVFFFNFTKLQFLNLRGIERIHFAESSGLSCWETEKEFLLPSLNFEKEDTLIILLSAWDRSRDSTAKRNLSKDM